MYRRRLLFGIGVLATLVAFSGPKVTAQDQPSLDELRAEVEQRQQNLERAEADLAEARGWLALAEGRKQQAAAEFQKVVSFREARLKALLARLGQICDPRTLADAEGELAVARVHVAEAEGKVE